VQAALGEAERALQRLVDARVTVAVVLTEPTSAAAGPAPRPVAGSVVLHRIEGMAASGLARIANASWMAEARALLFSVGQRSVGQREETGP
jgi:hypothetical protein